VVQLQYQTYNFYTPFTRSSYHQANIKQLEHTSCMSILNAFAERLLDVCLIV